ncbi:MAG: type IV pilin-like G/H family protein [Cyanobacteria bacterium P01_H01_bin.152]
MKTSFTYNLLKHLREKKAQGGFTLIELLVVIIIIGILAAIALPAFLNQANRARESEASNYVGAVNRGQQAYFLEELQFATELAQMEVAVPNTTKNFTYGDAQTAPTAGDLSSTDTQLWAAVYAVPNADTLKGFAGLVYNNPNNSQAVLLCRDAVAGTAGVDFALTATEGGANNGNGQCPANSDAL